MFIDWKSLAINGIQMKSLKTSDGVILFKKDGDIPEVMLTFTAQAVQSTIKLNRVGEPGAIELQYKLNDGSWNTFISDAVPAAKITLANVGDRVCMRATDENATFSKDNSNYYQFAMSGKIAASGSIQYLLSKDGDKTDAPAYCYCRMFSGCTSLTAAPDLPATQLASGCYYSMFYGCTSLTTAPQLPATQLAVRCYNRMFQNCTSLTAAPDLPATQLASHCYYGMFSGCTSLTAAPDLPATQLANSYCYYGMFSGCTSLTAAPDLPATQLASGCYYSMFYGCTNLSSVDVRFEAWSPSDATAYWVNGVASLGTFTCPTGLPQTRGISNIPTNWTIVTK